MEHDTTTEQNIRARMERVVPSRVLFDTTMVRVTKGQQQRSTSMKALPSPYQSLFSTMRTKIIGLSFVVVAIVALVVLKTNNPQVVPSPTTPAQTTQTASASSDSADQIVASLIDDATAEEAIGSSEEEDSTSLTQDLEDYNVDDSALI